MTLSQTCTSCRVQCVCFEPHDTKSNLHLLQCAVCLLSATLMQASLISPGLILQQHAKHIAHIQQKLRALYFLQMTAPLCCRGFS